MRKYIERLKIEIYEVVQHFISLLPGVFGSWIRQKFYKFYLKDCGKSFTTGVFIRIQVPSAVKIGDNVGLNDRVWIAANKDINGSITIGNNVIIGPNTILHSGNHRFDSLEIPIKKQGYEFSKIVIEDDVWIAANVTILSGVHIGKGAIIAASSVVTKNVLPYSIMGGIPAKMISMRTND